MDSKRERDAIASLSIIETNRASDDGVKKYAALCNADLPTLVRFMRNTASDLVAVTAIMNARIGAEGPRTETETLKKLCAEADLFLDTLAGDKRTALVLKGLVIMAAMIELTAAMQVVEQAAKS